jgi:hypothetical protein
MVCRGAIVVGTPLPLSAVLFYPTFGGEGMTLQEELILAQEQAKLAENTLRQFYEDLRSYETRQMQRAEAGLAIEAKGSDVQAKVLELKHEKAQRKVRELQERTWAYNLAQHQKGVDEVRRKIAALLKQLVPLCLEERRLAAPCCPHIPVLSTNILQVIEHSSLYKG